MSIHRSSYDKTCRTSYKLASVYKTKFKCHNSANSPNKRFQMENMNYSLHTHCPANSKILNKLFFLNVTFLCFTNIILKFCWLITKLCMEKNKSLSHCIISCSIFEHAFLIEQIFPLIHLKKLLVNLTLGGLQVFKFASVGSWNMWLFSSGDENNF